MSNVEYKPAEKLEIRLNRQDSSTSWGFRLQGGTDFNTTLSIQSVNPKSVAENCGLKPGDAILIINGATSDALTHDEAKAEIVKSGNEIVMLVERGAVKIWKPKVTPFNELRPQELKIFTSAIDEDIQPIQKTSLAANKSPDEPCRIGSSHNRSPQPFGKPKITFPNSDHSPYNTPIGLYSDNNIANTWNQQTAVINNHLQGLDIKDAPLGSSNEGSGHGVEHEDSVSGRRGERNEVGGFRSVNAPVTKPQSDKPEQSSMTCGGCNMLATGVIVKANGVPYHVDCFKCSSCSVNLKQKGFFVVDDKLYCETDAKLQARPPEQNMDAVAVYR
uniref:PDZ and LIM domain protein Zasp n=1 Tax=Arion vulgaris TaxID=1028688 RepID=A0A0B6Z7E5_9EUPU